MWWDELNESAYAPTPNRSHDANAPMFYFNSITSRKPILNAISGEQYYYLDSNNKKWPYRIGSRDQGRFYSVIMGDPDNPKEACKLFFDSPEQYENYTGIKVCAQSKENFASRKKRFDMVNQYELREKM